jgi:hypothetical protein
VDINGVIAIQDCVERDVNGRRRLPIDDVGQWILDSSHAGAESRVDMRSLIGSVSSGIGADVNDDQCLVALRRKNYSPGLGCISTGPEREIKRRTLSGQGTGRDGRQ